MPLTGGASGPPPPGGVPVAQYEALLAEVRGLRRRAQRVQRLARPLLAGDGGGGSGRDAAANRSQNNALNEPLDYTMESLLLDRQHGGSPSPNYDRPVSTQSQATAESLTSEEECFGQVLATRSHISVSSEPTRGQSGLEGLYHGTWPVERTLWSSEPTSLGHAGTRRESNVGTQMEVTSVMSFASSSGAVPLDTVLADRAPKWTNQQLEAKMDVVHSLLSMLGSQDHIDMGETLLALSACPESCLAMRQSGCIPLLVQLVQSDKDVENRRKAAQALHNLVNSQPDEKLRKRESRILKLLEQARSYTECLKNNTEFELETSSISSMSEDGDKHPVQTIAHLMKLSFDEGHRQAICQLGGIHIIAHLVEGEHLTHGSTTTETHCILLRRYACMALTNLTFGDSGNKALLCSYRDFMRSLVVQLQSPCDELRQVTASVLRNLSWRADSTSKEILREVGSVTGLMKAAMLDNKENTLKSILSALWNLSAHCTENKSEICAVEGALGFLVTMLSYKTPSKSLAIIENSGGILRNISSQIAVREDYREVLRRHNCLRVLLDQLKSPSLTIVSNACGTLWNLSAKCGADQETLWEMGAPAMLRSLNHSKHKMIAMGSSAALKNLLSAKPNQGIIQQLDSTALSLNLPELPTLGARKQKALLQDLDASLTETYENIEKDSPVKTKSDKVIDFAQNQPKRKDLKDDLNQAFSSLNINEPSTSFNFKSKQSFAAASLPYVQSPIKRGSPCTFIPVRNKFTDYEDEIDTSDQPIDYSRKYSETKTSNEANNGADKKTDEKDGSFGIYAETDLDQPTDYSLRYAEDDSDSDICGKPSKNEQQDFDTVKTYCTEGTPYETPFIFSNATSMSDLRDKQPIDNDIQKEKSKKIKEIKIEDEKDHCSTEDISEIDNAAKPMEKIPKSEFSSGLTSPEKPVNYCEEGTPGYFSRVSSFGSLNSIPVNETVAEKNGSKRTVTTKEEETKKEAMEKTATSKASSEMKNVKFEATVNYAEQTPLMFSRSSSLASLDSIEQHSIHDDRSSVVSDFSRLTSGVVSPSELPDSPTQTVPPSPKPRVSATPSTSKRRIPESRTRILSKTLQKPSVFEDNITKFKEESTPMQFSTATSLSSLTIDDHDETQGDSKTRTRPPTDTSSSTNTNAESVIHKEEFQEKKDAEKESRSSGEFNQGSEVDSDDVDEDILLACINDGMQNNRHTQPAPTVATSTPSKLPTFKYQPKPSNIPTVRKSPRNVPEEAPKMYCTEDTPAQLSRVGSNSNLSALSTPNDRKSRGDYLSDDSSNLSGENDNILAECIQSAMPKAKNENASSKRGVPLKYVGSSKGEAGLNKYGAGRSVIKKESNRPERYAVENSSGQFSVGSLGDLTTDARVPGVNRVSRGLNQLQGATNRDRPSSSKKEQETKLNISQEHNVSQESQEQQRKDSLSSISIESLEDEKALLEQCIYSAMPTAQTDEALLQECIQAGMPKTVDGNKPESSANVARRSLPTPPAEPPYKMKSGNRDVTSEGDKIESDRLPKNGIAAPAAAHVDTRVAAGGGDGPPASARTPTSRPRDPRGPPDPLPASCSPSVGTSSAELEKSGSNRSPTESIDLSYVNSIDGRLNKSCEESKILDNRMLDPDAMIESLDRFTAELVSQASHLNKDDTYRVSTSDNTWNDESSPNEVTFPSISGSAPNVITFESEDSSKDAIDGIEHESNDFSSVNTSTMTESTLIAIEATKMATVFKNEADMSQSVTSLELDSIRPPSQMNSLTNSVTNIPKSPKLAARKRSLPVGLLAKRALSNSLNHASSIESISNLDHTNPPSDLQNVFDMEGSMTSVGSLPNDEYKGDFIINGPTSKGKETQLHNPIFDVKQPYTGGLNSCIDLENINPPSIFNEITDMCSSLADVPTDAICSETEVFEDCYTQVADVTLQDDVTEFSDANSITPIQSDLSSAESTPKKPGKLSKSMMTKQRRDLARDRYKTYVVGAEMVMREEHSKVETNELSAAEYHTVCEDVSESSVTYVSPTYSVTSPKVTPKERRQSDRSRYETQVLEESVTANLPVIEPLKADSESSVGSSPAQSPSRTKLSIRRNFMQKRLENRERFQTQTLSESSFHEISSASPPVSEGQDIHVMVRKEADFVLKTLANTTTITDEMLDCETLSLVSNDDDSEHNSGGSTNYRTYRKSCGTRPGNVPVIDALADCQLNSEREPNKNERSEEEKVVKPKIVKPIEKVAAKEEEVVEEQPKGIRGRRKPLYVKTNINNNKVATKNIKPVRNVTSNLVKNVTSTLKAATPLKSTANKQNKTVTTRPPIPQTRTPSRPVSSSNSPKTSPARMAKTPIAGKTTKTPQGTPPLERQGTFTKEEPPKSRVPSASKIPAFTSKIARAVTPNRLQGNNNNPRGIPVRKGTNAEKNRRVYGRSTSADSRETTTRAVRASPSTQSLKSEVRTPPNQNGAVKKSSIPSPAKRSSSNSSITSNGSVGARKQVTSKIASIWKKIEESKNKPPKKDTRVWIQKENEIKAEEAPRLIRSNTFDNKDAVILRKKTSEEDADGTKRVSRLGSFIVMDENGEPLNANIG